MSNSVEGATFNSWAYFLVDYVQYASSISLQPHDNSPFPPSGFVSLTLLYFPHFTFPFTIFGCGGQLGTEDALKHIVIIFALVASQNSWQCSVLGIFLQTGDYWTSQKLNNNRINTTSLPELWRTSRRAMPDSLQSYEKFPPDPRRTPGRAIPRKSKCSTIESL